MTCAVLGLAGLLPAVSPGAAGAPTLARSSEPPPPGPVPAPDVSPPASSPPNVLFLVDNNKSMLDFARYLPEDFTPGFSPPANSKPGTRGYVGKEGSFLNTGCSDPALVAAMSWFDLSSSDPAKNGFTPVEPPVATLDPTFFNPGLYYHARGRRLAWQAEDFPYSLSSNQQTVRAQSAARASCNEVVNWNTADYDSPGSKEVMNECQTCLATKGWWRGPLITASTNPPFTDSDFPPEKNVHLTGQPPPAPAAYRKWVVSGGVLNLNPPKFLAMRKGLKDFIQAARGTRMGLATYNQQDLGWFDAPKMVAELNPTCSQSAPFFNEGFVNRERLTWEIDHLLFVNTDHPAGESLFGLGGYFSSGSNWRLWFEQPVNPGFFGWPGCCTGGSPDNPDTGAPGGGWAASYSEWGGWGASYNDSTKTWGHGQPWDRGGDNRSICFGDQVSAVVLLTSGPPRYDNSVPITQMMQLLKAQGARHADGSLVQFDPANPATNPSVGGINYCDQIEKNPVTHEKYTQADCDSTAYNWPAGLGVGNKNFMDDVAFFLSHTDLREDLPGDQTVRTYVVNVGEGGPMLQSMTLAGQGQFYRADTATRVRLALQSAVSDIQGMPVSYLPPPSSPRPPANVLLLMGNTKSMQDFSEYLPEDFTTGFSPPPNSKPGTRGYVGKEGDFVNTGCADPALLNKMSWFDKNSLDPSQNGSSVFDSDPDLGWPFFAKDQFFQARGRRLGWQTEDFPYSLGSNFQSLNTTQDALSACYQVVSWNVSDYYSPGSQEVMNECIACLQTKGWWRGPRISGSTQAPFRDSDYSPPPGSVPPPPAAYRKWVVSGGVLNLRPPKFVVARKVLKDVLHETTTARIGVATLSGGPGWFNPPSVPEPVRPNCGKSLPSVDVTALDPDRLARAVNAIRFGVGDRSVGEALFGAGGYFSSKADGRWQGWFQQPLNPGFGWPGCCNGGTFDNPATGQSGATWAAASDEWLKAPSWDPATGEPWPGQPWEGTGLDTSVCALGQESAVIVITDGPPRNDNSVPITQMMQLLVAQGARHPNGSLVRFDPANPATNPDVGGINYCDQFSKDGWVNYTKQDCDYTDFNWPTGLGVGNKNFMDDVAFFLSHADLRGDLPGDQTVRTFVVGMGDHSPMLQSMALAGRGSFYRTNNGTELRNALRNAFWQLTAPASTMSRGTP